MEDPEREIAEVARLVIGAADPELQDAAVLKYCAPDMAFRHPMSVVEPAPDSRAALLAILDWYRLLSPVRVRVDRVAYVAEAQTAFVDATQVFCVRWSPFGPAAARLLIRFKLRQEPAPTPGDAARTVWVIAEQEDFYHPDALMAMFVPPLAPLVRWALGVGAAACRVGAGVLRGLGC